MIDLILIAFFALDDRQFFSSESVPLSFIFRELVYPSCVSLFVIMLWPHKVDPGTAHMNQLADWIFFGWSFLRRSLLPTPEGAAESIKPFPEVLFLHRRRGANCANISALMSSTVSATNRLLSLFVPFSTLHRPDAVCCKPTPSLMLNLTVSICRPHVIRPVLKRLYLSNHMWFRPTFQKGRFKTRRWSWHWVAILSLDIEWKGKICFYH